VDLDGFALPVKKLKGTDPVETLDLSCKNLGVASLVVIASLISVNSALTVANLLGNQLDVESAKLLAEVAKQKGISLCGIRRDQSTADFAIQGLGPGDAILISSDLVRGGLTSIDLSGNQLCGIWTDREGDQEGTYTAEGITAIADAMRVNGALTKLSLAKNKLEEEGTKAICEALEQNTTLKELDISGEWHRSNIGGDYIGGSAGAKHVAKMLGVNGVLTSIDLSGNQLCGIGDDYWGNEQGTYTAEGIKAIADALRVNGGLTSINLSGNHLTNRGWYGKEGIIGKEGIKELAAALGVNGALTKIE